MLRTTHHMWTTVVGCAAVTATAAATLAATADPAAAIIGGHPASWPPAGIASLQVARGADPDHPRCVATLIAARYAVTNAHCVTLQDATPMDPALFHLRIGSTGRTSGGTVTTVTAIWPHPAWDWAAGDDPVADIAVLQLAAPVPARPATIPTRQVRSRYTTVAGWGMTEPGAATPPDRLQEITVTIVPADRCAAGGITAGEICFETAPGTGPCNGDSGASVTQHTSTHRAVSVGAVSRETTDACAAGPMIATDLTTYRTWIFDTIRAGRTTPPAPAAHPSTAASTRQLRWSTGDRR